MSYLNRSDLARQIVTAVGEWASGLPLDAIRVETQGDSLLLVDSANPADTIIWKPLLLLQDYSDPVEGAEVALISILGALQDEESIRSGVPWPPARGHVGFPNVRVTRTDDLIIGGYAINGDWLKDIARVEFEVTPC